MNIKTLLKFSLSLILLLNLTACNKKEEERKELKASLPKPLVKENDINKYYKFSEYLNADHDPASATKIGFAYSQELKDYEKAIEWYKYSNSMKPSGANSNYACYAYQQLKQFDEAISWCKQAVELGEDEALFQLSSSYFGAKDFNNALLTFKTHYDKTKDTASLSNIGACYIELNNYPEAENYFKKAISLGNYDSYENIATLYHTNLKDDVKASAYAIAVIETAFSKHSVIKLLKDTWKIPAKTIKQGYELQLNSPEFLVKYKGDLGL